MSFTPIVVTATYAPPDGSTPIGAVSFQLTGVMTNGGVTAPATVKTVKVNGSPIAVTLDANDDVGTLERGVGYRITETINGETRIYVRIIPSAAPGGTIDLSDLAPTTTTPNVAYLLLPPGPTTNDVVTWDGTKPIWAAPTGGVGATLHGVVRTAGAAVADGERTVFTGSTASQILVLSTSGAPDGTVNTITNLASVMVGLASAGTIDDGGVVGSFYVPVGGTVELTSIGNVWYVTSSNFGKLGAAGSAAKPWLVVSGQHVLEGAGGPRYRTTGYAGYDVVPTWYSTVPNAFAMSPAQVEKFMAQLRPNSLLRVWCIAPAGGFTWQQARDNMDIVVDLATAYGHRLALIINQYAGTLNTLYVGTGSTAPKLGSNWFSTQQYLNTVRTDGKALQDWVQWIVPHYAANPTVAIYDLCNEPKATGTDQPSASDLTTYANTVYGWVKAANPNALVYMGVANTTDVGGSANFTSISAGMDFLSAHDYDCLGYPTKGYDSVSLAAGRPVLVDEFGVWAKGTYGAPTDPDLDTNGHPAVSIGAQGDLVKSYLDDIFGSDEVFGALLWTMADTDEGTPVTFTSVATTSGSAVIACPTGWAGVTKRMLIQGPGIPLNAYVNAISGNNLTLGLNGANVNATATSTVTVTVLPTPYSGLGDYTPFNGSPARSSVRNVDLKGIGFDQRTVDAMNGWIDPAFVLDFPPGTQLGGPNSGSTVNYTIRDRWMGTGRAQYRQNSPASAGPTTQQGVIPGRRPSLLFGGAHWYNASSWDLGTAKAHTLFAVIMPTAYPTAGLAGRCRIVGGNGGDGFTVSMDSSGHILLQQSGLSASVIIGTGATALALNVLHLVEVRWDASSTSQTAGKWEIWVDGVLDASGTTTGTLTASTADIGGARPRTDTVTITAGSATVVDAAYLSSDTGKLITTTGTATLPSPTYVGSATGGGFLLSSSPTSQVNVNAGGTGTSTTATVIPQGFTGHMGSLIHFTSYTTARERALVLALLGILHGAFPVASTSSGGGSGVASFQGRTGAVSITKADVTGTGLTAGDIGADAAGAATSAQTAAEAYSDAALSTALAGLAPAEAPAAAQGSGLTHSGVGQVIGGVTVTPGMRILDTASGISSGLWVAAAGSWTRPVDFATGSNAQGKLVEYDGGGLWLCVSTSTITVDTTSQVWTQIDASVIQAGTGMSKSGTTISLALTKALVVATGIAPSDIGGASTGDVAARMYALARANVVTSTPGSPVAANSLIPVDSTSGTINIPLPVAPADKVMVAIKHVIQGGTNAVTFSCGGSDVFNFTGGVTSKSLPLLSQGVLLEYTASGAIWTVISDDLPLSALDLRYIRLPASPSSGQVPEWNGSSWVPATLPPTTTTYGSATFIGHSWLSGVGSNNPGGFDRSVMGKIAAALGVPAFNIRAFAQSGGMLSTPNLAPTSCDYGSMSQLLVPEGTSALESQLVAANLGVSYLANPSMLASIQDSGLVVWLTGINDSLRLALGWVSYAGFVHSMRLQLARSLAGIVVPWTDSSLAFGTGTWATQPTSTANPVNSGPSYNKTSSSGAVFTLTIPAAFPGGWVDIHLIGTSSQDTSGCSVAWSGTASGAGTISIAGTPTFTAAGTGNGPLTVARSTGSWITDGAVVGMGFASSGGTANNKVIGVTATTLTLLYSAGTPGTITGVSVGATPCTVGGQGGTYNNVTFWEQGIIYRFWCQPSDAGKTIIGTFSLGSGGSPALGVDSWTLEAPFANQGPKLWANIPRHSYGSFWDACDPITTGPKMNATMAAVLAEFNGAQPATSTAPPTNTNVALVDLDALWFPKSGMLTSSIASNVATTIAVTTNGGTDADNSFNPGPTYGGSAFPISVANAVALPEVMWVTNVALAAGGDPRTATDPNGKLYIPTGTALTLTVVRAQNGSTALTGAAGLGSTGAWVGDATWMWVDSVHPNMDGAAVIAAAYENVLHTVPNANKATTVAQGSGTWTSGRSMPVNGVVNNSRLYVAGSGKNNKTLVAGEFYVTPVYVPVRSTLVDMGIYLSAIGSGTWTMVMAIYLPDGTGGRPGQALTTFNAATILQSKVTAGQDATMLTKAGAAGAGTPVRMVLEPGLYWIGVGVIGGTTQPVAAAIEEVAGPAASTMMVPDAESSMLNLNGFYLTGQSAAPNVFTSNPFTASLYSGMMPRLWLKLGASSLYPL